MWASDWRMIKTRRFVTAERLGTGDLRRLRLPVLPWWGLDLIGAWKRANCSSVTAYVIRIIPFIMRKLFLHLPSAWLSFLHPHALS